MTLLRCCQQVAARRGHASIVTVSTRTSSRAHRRRFRPGASSWPQWSVVRSWPCANWPGTTAARRFATAPCFVIMRWWLSIKYGRSSNSSSTRQTQMAQLHLPTATRSKKNHRSIYGAEMFPWTRPDGSSTPSPKRPTSSFTIPVLQMQPISWCKFVVPDHPHSVKRQLLYWTFMRSFTMDSCRLEST